MKISTKGRYAIKLMLDLAVHDTGQPIKLADIAARQHISDKYLEQIVSTLKKASLVRSSRGYKGGYRLTMKPQNYTIGMILRTMEGDLSPVDCAVLRGESCENGESCVTVKIWERLDKAVKSVLDEMRLSDLLEWQKETEAKKVMETRKKELG